MRSIKKSVSNSGLVNKNKIPVDGEVISNCLELFLKLKACHSVQWNWELLNYLDLLFLTDGLPVLFI